MAIRFVRDLNTYAQHDAETMEWFWSGLCCRTHFSR